jgi:DNA-binding NarL/FixJ family response regulator
MSLALKAGMTRKHGIAILSDQTLFREGLSELLHHRGTHHIEEFTNRAALLEAAKHLPPDLVLLDLDHEAEDTATVVRALRHDLPRSQLIVIGSPLRQGAVPSAGLDTPDADTAALLKTIALAPLGLRLSSSAEKHRKIWSHITARQRDVMRWLATGADNETIARKLRIGVRAVKAHVSALLELFGRNNRTELALLADHAGLRPPAARAQG